MTFSKRFPIRFMFVCLFIWILRAYAIPKPLDNILFFAAGLLFPAHSTHNVKFLWQGLRLATIFFTSIAENRYSHSHSKPYYSYSHRRTPHSHHYSHYRRTKRPDNGQPNFFMFLTYHFSSAPDLGALRFSLAGCSKAENRNAQAHTKPSHSYSQRRTPHSHQNSHHRRTKRPFLTFRL